METYEKEEINQFDSGDLLNQQSNPRTGEATYDSFLAPKNGNVEEDEEDDLALEEDDLDNDEDDIEDAEVVEEDDDDESLNRGTMAS